MVMLPTIPLFPNFNVEDKNAILPNVDLMATPKVKIPVVCTMGGLKGFEPQTPRGQQKQLVLVLLFGNNWCNGLSILLCLCLNIVEEKGIAGGKFSPYAAP